MGIPEIREGTFDGLFGGRTTISQEFSERIQENSQLAAMIGIVAEHFQKEYDDVAGEMFIRGALALLHIVDAELDAREMDEWLK